MSDLLPLVVNPWLLYQRREAIKGRLPFDAMPHFVASQHQAHGFATVGLEVTQREDGLVVLSGRAEAKEARLVCQRCLEMMRVPVFAEFALVLVKHDAQLATIEASEDTIVCEADLALAPVIEQELILALPMIAKHDDCLMKHENGEDSLSDRQHPFANLKDVLN